MLRDFFENKKISIYKASKESKIPYTTLNEIILGKKSPDTINVKTLSSLAKYMGVSMEMMHGIIKGEYKSVPSISHTWESARHKKYCFPVISKSSFPGISRIHPLQQKKISEIYNHIKNDRRVDELYIFGSSTTIRCNGKSDIDVAIGLKKEYLSLDTKSEISEIIQNACEYNADIIWIDRITANSKIDCNIREGVKII